MVIFWIPYLAKIWKRNVNFLENDRPSIFGKLEILDHFFDVKFKKFCKNHQKIFIFLKKFIFFSLLWKIQVSKIRKFEISTFKNSLYVSKIWKWYENKERDFQNGKIIFFKKFFKNRFLTKFSIFWFSRNTFFSSWDHQKIF